MHTRESSRRNKSRVVFVWSESLVELVASQFAHFTASRVHNTHCLRALLLYCSGVLYYSVLNTSCTQRQQNYAVFLYSYKQIYCRCMYVWFCMSIFTAVHLVRVLTFYICCYSMFRLPGSIYMYILVGTADFPINK